MCWTLNTIIIINDVANTNASEHGMTHGHSIFFCASFHPSRFLSSVPLKSILMVHIDRNHYKKHNTKINWLSCLLFLIFCHPSPTPQTESSRYAQRSLRCASQQCWVPWGSISRSDPWDAFGFVFSEFSAEQELPIESRWNVHCY